MYRKTLNAVQLDDTVFLLFFFQERGSLHSKRRKADVSSAVQCSQREVEHWQPNLPGVSGNCKLVTVNSVQFPRQNLLLKHIETFN